MFQNNSDFMYLSAACDMSCHRVLLGTYISFFCLYKICFYHVLILIPLNVMSTFDVGVYTFLSYLYLFCLYNNCISNVNFNPTKCDVYTRCVYTLSV